MMRTRFLFHSIVSASLLFGLMQGTGFCQMGTPADDGCTDVDEVIVCEGEAGDTTLECDDGGEVRIGSDGKKRLFPGGKVLRPVVPSTPSPCPNPSPAPTPGPTSGPSTNPTSGPSSNPTSGAGAWGADAGDTIGVYVAEGLNASGGLTFVVILNDQQNPHDSPGPDAGEKEFTYDPQSDGCSEIEWVYLMLLEMGLTEQEAISLFISTTDFGDDACDCYLEMGWTYLMMLETGLNEHEAMSILVGQEKAEDEDPSPTRIKKPVHGPLITSFDD
ncbi:MAG: hypothetical protein VXZ82_03520 [Planctomycetota bacterium]|nr:hypothetical protein [Planctomycetota bacterium]